MMKREERNGMLCALVTILIWGTTFISTKVLLTDFTPVEILFFRFALGFLALAAICPRRLKARGAKEEGTFILAGLCGICLYYLLENLALSYTLASNVGVMVSVAPFFTALITRLTTPKGERLGMNFILGFIISMAGICLISFGGSQMRLNPLGDVLALAAAFLWACYSVLSRRIAGFGYPVVQTTRRVFFYGLLWMLPALWMFDVKWKPARFADPAALANLLFLGLGASALCFVTWNVAVKALGAVKTSAFIYLVPVITLVASALVLRETLTLPAIAGALLTQIGRAHV